MQWRPVGDAEHPRILARARLFVCADAGNTEYSFNLALKNAALVPRKCDSTVANSRLDFIQLP